MRARAPARARRAATVTRDERRPSLVTGSRDQALRARGSGALDYKSAYSAAARSASAPSAERSLCSAAAR